MQPSPRLGVAYLVLSALVYAFLPIFANWAYDAGIPPVDLVIWRFILATPVVWLTIRFLPGSTPTLRGYPVRYMLLMGVMWATIALLAFIGLERIPASIYILLVYAYPVIVALIGTFSGDRLPPQGWLALLLTMIGLLLTIPEIGGDLGDTDALGLGIAALNAILVSVHVVLMNRGLRGRSDTRLATALNMTGALLLLLLILPFNGLTVPTTFEGWASVLGLGLVTTVLGMHFFFLGMQHVGPSRASILSMLEPVLVLLLSMLLLGERLLLVQVIGALLILSSPIILQTKLRLPRRRREAPVLR